MSYYIINLHLVGQMSLPCWFHLKSVDVFVGIALNYIDMERTGSLQYWVFSTRGMFYNLHLFRFFIPSIAFYNFFIKDFFLLLDLYPGNIGYYCLFILFFYCNIGTLDYRFIVDFCTLIFISAELFVMLSWNSLRQIYIFHFTCK